jgi:hypothetical protein
MQMRKGTTRTLDHWKSHGHRHSLEVTAETLYEAVAHGLAAFKGDQWVGSVGRLDTVTVRVQQPMIEHHVRIAEFEKWLDTHGKSPAETILKARLRSIVGSSKQVDKT